MPSQHRIITNAGTTIWFAAGGASPAVPYTGSGTPWTSQATTPFEIAMNDATGPQWAPVVPEVNTVFGGGGPFRHGAMPVYSAYTNAVEALPIQIRGTTTDTKTAALALLRIELQTALFAGPLIFVFQPDGAANPVYYEVSAASVQELPTYINDEFSSDLLRANITMTRQPFGGVTSLTTLINNQTATNNSTTGTNPNLITLTGMSGDLQNEGTPINVRVADLSVTNSLTKLLLATVASRTATAASGSTFTTSSTTAVAGASYTFTATAAQTNLALKPRFLLRLTSQSVNCEIRIRVITGSTGTGFTVVYTSAWVGRVSSTGVGLTDFGTWSLDYLRALNITATDFIVIVDQRSTNGASASYKDDYGELLLYYDFARVDMPGTSSNALNYYVEGLRKPQNGPYLPRYPLYAYSGASGGAVQFVCAPPRGQLRAFKGCSLWLAWYVSNTDDGHIKADTVKVFVYTAPLFLTVRGS